MERCSARTSVVLGQGPIGLSFTAILARSGVSTLVAVDPLDYRLEYSTMLGATHAVNPTRTSTEEAVLDILSGEKPDIIVEAAGYTDTLNTALRLVKSFGIAMMFGIQQKSREHGFVVPMEYKDFRGSNARLKTVAAGHTEDILSHIELMVELKQRGCGTPLSSLRTDCPSTRYSAPSTCTSITTMASSRSSWSARDFVLSPSLGGR